MFLLIQSHRVFCSILVERADTLELINNRGANKKRARTLDHKPWYDSDCEKHRKRFTRTRLFTIVQENSRSQNRHYS